MKVVFMRHGKAADITDFDDDFERNLTTRGKSEVRQQIGILMQHEIIPKHIITSPACRAASTARIAAQLLQVDSDKIEYISALYMGSVSDFLEAAQNQTEEVVLIVGHNPAIEQISTWYHPGQPHRFPTSSIVVLEFDKNDDILKSAKPVLKLIRE